MRTKAEKFGSTKEWAIESTIWQGIVDKIGPSTHPDVTPPLLLEICKKLTALIKGFSNDSFDADMDLEEAFRSLLTKFTKELSENMMHCSKMHEDKTILADFSRGQELIHDFYAGIRDVVQHQRKEEAKKHPLLAQFFDYHFDNRV